MSKELDLEKQETEMDLRLLRVDYDEKMKDHQANLEPIKSKLEKVLTEHKEALNAKANFKVQLPKMPQEIKVFEGEFKTVVTDRHVLRLKLLEDEDAKPTGESEIL